MKKRLKINGIIIFIVIILIATSPAIFFRRASKNLFDEIVEISGAAFILLGQILRVSSRGYKSEYSQKGNVLIQGGPYNLVRNPMYLGILLIGLGIVAILFKWWVGGIFLSIFITRYLLLIFKEEKKLLMLFPKEYPQYQRRVNRLLPSFKVISQRDVSEYLPIKLPWLKKEIGTILAVLLITLLVESWEDIGQEGIRAFFSELVVTVIIIILFIGLVIYLSRRTEGFAKDVSTKSQTHF